MSSPIRCDGENKGDDGKAVANDDNGSNVIVRRERPSRACTVRSAARLHATAAAEAVVSDVRKQKHRRRPARREIEEEEEEEQPPSPPNPYSSIVTPLVAEPPLSQLTRWNIRSMSELASILNFFNVFRPLLNIKVEFSVEEFETALITPNATLADIHIPLLKAIPPVTRVALGRNTWVTVLCRKLRDWWHWVAEGELPIVASHGGEFETYNTLDPAVRVIILKALCDIRVEQEDIRNYIDESIKNGVPLSAFRKERNGGDSHGVSYWYEDDPIIGQRLYRGIRKVEVKKGKGKNVLSVPSYQWETVATNLDDFQEISEKLSSSKNRTEVSLAKKIQNDMLPEIEKVHKRKEKLIKKQQRQALLLDSMIIDGLGPGRSKRGRKPVSYTFDDYDQSINEAIKLTKAQPPSKPIVRREGLRHHHHDASTNGTFGGPSQNSPQASLSPSSHDSLNLDEPDEDHASDEPLDRSNRKRSRPQRYSTREFVEAVSDNDADYSDDDIVGEAVYDEEYLKQRKRTRTMSSSSEEEEDEYHLEEDNVEDEDEEDEGDDSLSASEEDSDAPPRRYKKLKVSGPTRRSKKLRSISDVQDGLRRSKRATRNRIDYKKYEFSESEPELDKPGKSNGSESNTPGFSMGSEDNNGNDDSDDEKDNDNDDDNEVAKVDRSTVMEEHPKAEKEEQNEPEPEPSIKLDDPVQDEFGGTEKRGFLDLNELAPGSGFEDGPSVKDEDSDNV
ncbi:DDT domain-containing protein DDR4-like [Rutidosis leptorrhynchoides]|uniref:DDT domain-containing protein DDR4-like n=1 Tax=Rutidosis leptorrhynchoides TaxID=125765 RepID=UPI003A9A652E